MSIIIKNKFVCEDILDEHNNVIGQIKFNPEDSNIMKTLAEILYDLNSSIKKLDNYKDLDLSKLSENSLAEDFENASNQIEKTKELFDLEYNVINKSINGLKDVFGENCINCFTGGTMDINALVPLINFIAPYVKESRSKKVNKFIDDNNDVMD